MTIFTIFSQPPKDEENINEEKKPQKDEKTIDQEEQPQKEDPEEDYLNERTISQGRTLAKIELILSCFTLILGIGSTVSWYGYLIPGYIHVDSYVPPGLNIILPVIGILSAARGLETFRPERRSKEKILSEHLLLSLISLVLSLILCGTSIYRAILATSGISVYFGLALVAVFCEANIAWMSVINTCAFAGSVWITSCCCNCKQRTTLAVKNFLPAVISQAKRIRQSVKEIQMRDAHDPKIKKQKRLATFQIIVSTVMLILGSISTGLLVSDYWARITTDKIDSSFVVALIFVPIIGIIGAGLAWECYKPAELRRDYILGGYLAICVWNVPLLIWLIVSTIQIIILANDYFPRTFVENCLTHGSCADAAVIFCEGNILWMSIVNLGVSISLIITVMTPWDLTVTKVMTKWTINKSIPNCWSLTLPTYHLLLEDPKTDTVSLDETYAGTEAVTVQEVQALDNAKATEDQAPNTGPVAGEHI